MKYISFITLYLSIAWGLTWQWSGRTHPELDWTTMSTEHFYVHFHQGIEDIAREGASIAEQVRPKSTVSDVTQKPETLLIQILESGNPTEDKFKIEDVFRLLLEYPGQDEVTLHIMSSNKLVKMVWPTTIKINAKLEERLGEVLGEENISVAK